MNLQTSLFLMVCTFFLGIAAGGYIASLRQGKGTSDLEGKPEPLDLIRLRKDPQSGTLEVEVAGQAFHSAADLDSTQRTQVGGIVDTLRDWLSAQPGPEQIVEVIPPVESAAITDAAAAVDAILDGTPAISVVGAAVPGVAAATPGAAPGTLPDKPEAVLSAAPVQQVAASSKPKDAQKAKNGLPEEMDGQAETQKVKRFSIGSTLSRFLWSETSTDLLSSISPAVQVNQILQEKLKNTPLEDRGICLKELPAQDMVVMIGEDKYDSVSAVPDDEIRGIIQASVDEWLARSTR